MAKLFLTVLLLFGSVTAGAFYLVPSWKEFSKIRRETQALRDISAELDGLAQNRDSLIQTINSVSAENIRRLNQSLPLGPKSAEFLVLIEAVAKNNNVILRQVNVTGAPQEKSRVNQPKPSGPPARTETTANTVKDFPISLAISGSYDAFKSFVSDLERSLRIIDIQSISFSSPADRNAVFEVNIRGKTYYQ